MDKTSSAEIFYAKPQEVYCKSCGSPFYLNRKGSNSSEFCDKCEEVNKLIKAFADDAERMGLIPESLND